MSLMTTLTNPKEGAAVNFLNMQVRTVMLVEPCVVS